MIIFCMKTLLCDIRGAIIILGINTFMKNCTFILKTENCKNETKSEFLKGLDFSEPNFSNA